MDDVATALARLMDESSRRIVDGKHPGDVANEDDGFYLDLGGEHQTDGLGDQVVSDAESVWWFIGDSFDTEPEGADISGAIGRQFVDEWRTLGDTRFNREVQATFFRDWRQRVWPGQGE